VELRIDPLLPELASEEERAQALAEVRAAAAGCRDCPLGDIGTQIVFGEGPVAARLMFIGEAPGAQEDKAGRPFIGPAGKLFDEALAAAGIDRSTVYVTNTVKHRPWIAGPTGRQKNRGPKQSEINACRQWRLRELALVRPAVVACLGAKAAQEVLGKDFRLTTQRGTWLHTPAAPHVLATLHPSYVLIQPDESRERVREQFFEDVRAVGQRYREVAGA
jgi:uracil-DNA glycosylase